MATQLATNPETGEVLAFVGGEWQKPQVIANDKGERMFLGERGWEAFPPPERGLGVRAARAAEFGARGFMNRAAETVGAVPDLVAAGLRAVGAPAPGPGFYTGAIKSGLDRFGRAVSAPLNAATQAAGVDMGPQQTETGGEKFAYGAGQGVADAASIMLPAAGVARMAAPGSVTARSAQAIAAQPVTQAASGAIGGGVGEAYDSPLLGAAAAVATPMAVAGFRRAVSPVTMSLTPEEVRRADLARGMGIDLTPGQATGSRPLQSVEAAFGQLPFTAGRQTAIYDAQRQAFNKAALAKAGISGDRVTPEVLDQAFRTIGAQFDDLAARTNLRIDPKFGQDVNRVVQEYGRRLPTDVAPTFQSYVDDINQLLVAQASGQNPQIDGRTFQNISSNLATAARNARNRPELQQALNSLRGAFDDVMDRSAQVRLPGQSGAGMSLADEWREVRKNYRNLLAIDEAAGAGTAADRAAGNLSFGATRAAIDRQDPRGFARGRSDMADIAQVSDFLAQRIPNSGTPERLMGMQIAQGGGLFGGVGGGSVLAGADPLTGAFMGAGALATPPMLQAAMNSPAGRAYLTNQFLTGRGPEMNRALLAALLGGQAKGELVSGP